MVFHFLTVSLALHEHIEFDGSGLCGTNLRQDGRLTLSQKKKMSKHFSICQWLWQREPMTPNTKQTCEQHRSYLHMLPKSNDDWAFHHVIIQHEVSCFCLLLVQKPGVIMTNILSSYLSFRLWPFDKLVAALWVMSIACQCSSFDGPSLVRYLITLFWQLNLSLWCSAPEKY